MEMSDNIHRSFGFIAINATLDLRNCGNINACGNRQSILKFSLKHDAKADFGDLDMTSVGSYLT